MSDHTEANVFDSGPGKRKRKAPERYFDEDEAKILARRGYDAEAMEEAERSDTEIPQTDDEEDEMEIELEEGEEDPDAVEDEDGDWHPGSEDVSTTDDDDDGADSDDSDDSAEPAQLVFFKFDEEGQLAYKAFGTDSICLEFSYDYPAEHRVMPLAAVVSSLCTIFVCEKPKTDLPRLVEMLHKEDPEEWPAQAETPACYTPKDVQILDNYVDLEEIDNFFYM